MLSNVNPRYWRKLKNSYKGLRTKVSAVSLTLLTAVVALPEESKTVAKIVAPETWVDTRWGTIVSAFSILSFFIHMHGSAREEADIPYDYRD